MHWPSFRSRTDLVLTGFVAACAVVAGAVLLVVAAFVLLESLPALRTIGLTRLFTDGEWRPTGGRFGIGSMLLATALVTAGAVLVAGPLGIASAAFRRYFAPPVVGRWYRRIVELLAGVPSVVFGLWGLVELVPRIASIQAPGTSLLAGILVLALMILPTVALTADTALGAVPRSHLDGAAALGLGRASTVLRVALPAARGGIGAGLVLATGRAIGETMAVLMVCGNVVQVPATPFDPVRTVTANIALEMGYADDRHRSALFLTGLLLIATIGALVAAAALVTRRPGRG